MSLSYSILQKSDALDSSIYYSIAPTSIFQTSSAGKGLIVCHHVSDSTGFSLPAWWVSGRRWFWITSAVSVYSGFIPITKPPWHSAAYSLHHSPDNKWLTWWKPVHLLCWKCRNGCKYTPNFALDWGLFTERAADCPPTLPGLIELICACPAAHSARLKMQKDSRQRRGRTKKKKEKKRCHRPCGGGEKVETELKEKTERGRMRG